MAVYEYQCRECDARFEVSRPMAEETVRGISCPAGHSDVRRRFSVFAAVSGGRTEGGAARPAASGGGGGCCGGSCGCR